MTNRRYRFPTVRDAADVVTWEIRLTHEPLGE